MEINLNNIPKAIAYFVVGVFVNIILYNIFSPNTVTGYPGLLGLLQNIFDMQDANPTVILIIWGGIMLIGIITNLLYPVWVLFDED